MIEGNAIGSCRTARRGHLARQRGRRHRRLRHVELGVQIGGPSAQDENVISGNTSDGIEINASSGVLVEGNLIGTSLTG